MPETPQQLATTIATLRKRVNAQGLVIQQQRELIRMLKATKVALVAGRFAADVDPYAEADKSKDFTRTPIEIFNRTLTALRQSASSPENTTARAVLDDIGR